MKNTPIIAIFTISLFINAAAKAEVKSEALTLNQALQEATKGSLELQKAESQKDEASWKKVESFSTFLPNVQLMAQKVTKQRYQTFNIPAFGPSDIPQIYPSADVTLQADYLIFDGFASTNRYMAGRRGAQAAEQKYDWTKFALERQVILQYYKALASQILKDVAEQNYKTLQDHSKDVGYSRKAGISTKFDTLRVDVQVSEAQSEILNATDNIEAAKNKLAEILGKDVEARQLQGTLPVLDMSLGEKAQLDAVVHRKDLEALQNSTEGIRYQDKAASRFWLPQLSVYGQYQYYNNRGGTTAGFGDTDNFRDAYQVGFNLKWNLFDGMSSIARAGQASERYFQADKDLQLARIQSKQDFDFWKRKFRYFCVVYKARVSDLEKATESVRLAREGRKAGVRTNTDLLDAELELFHARAGVVNAQVGAIEALINLEMVTGQKLYSFN